MLWSSCLATVLLFSIPVLSQSSKFIVSGAVWLDTEGNPINAHGGGVIKANDTFYWVGQAIGCCGTTLYSSPDLVTWTNHGTVYNTSVSRPKLVFSEPEGLWKVPVLFFLLKGLVVNWHCIDIRSGEPTDGHRVFA